MSTIVTDTYSDHDMQCPAAWENGFKEGLVISFGDGERVASHPWTGDWSGSTFTFVIADTGVVQRRFRQQLASGTDRYWTLPLVIPMTTRANRAVLGIPYVVFVGPIIEVRPVSKLALELTLGDIVSQGMLADHHQIPWRMIRDGFIGELDTLSEALDLEAPEPIIYGQHRRVPDVDPASPQGFQYTPIYLGIEGAYHLWMVCGHACADLPDVLVWTPDPDGGLGTSVSVLGSGNWQIPHTSAPAYEDRRSATYSNDRRYTIIRGLVGDADADACALGEKVLAVFVDGVEPVGDGTGAVILDRLQQYKHFLINYVAHRGQDSYQSGAWLTNPTWDVFGTLVEIVEEASFDACSAIAVERLPAPGSPSDAGYLGAAIIGATASDRSSVKRWIADWNRSCGVQFGITHLGEMRVFMLHPTAAIKAAAPLYTDAYEILLDSFGTDVQWQGKVNRVPFRADPEYTSGQWKTADVASIDGSITLYGGAITGDMREYPFAPGMTAAFHLARLEALVRMHPPRLITLEASVGPLYQSSATDPGDSLGYLDLGDYIRYQHFDAVGSAAQIRLAQIVRHQVQAGKRRVLVEALDCEDLIDYDAYIVPSASGGDDACATAIVITEAEATGVGGYTIEIDTTTHATDGAAPVPSCGSGVAYHAAWWSYTPTFAQKGHVTTGTSEYDTVLAVFTGACGALTELACNDNDGIFQTSFIDFTGSGPMIFESGVTHKILVHGFGPDDAGSLVFTFFAEPL